LKEILICYGRSGVYRKRFTPIYKKSHQFLKLKKKVLWMECRHSQTLQSICTDMTGELVRCISDKMKMPVCETIWRNSGTVGAYWTNCGTWGSDV